ncbi:MAG TPA: class I SAM-dependent methyltransferase [Mucilaginibacter sp.]|nr:class I SAM-dependent methyltransferase [Mucilaginibacter sp.]
MEFKQIAGIVAGIPHMTSAQGEIIYSLVRNSNISNILELGFAHGVSTCYMAAALQAKGGGKIMTIDRMQAKEREPSIHDLLEKTKLDKYIDIIFANKTYNWELMKLIEENTKDGVCQPQFDFCFLDGAHNFEIDCAAFFLADKLLKPGAYLLLDDLFWTYDSSPSLKNTDFVRQMDDEERNIPHIKKLFDLVIMQHPDYTDFKVEGEWAWARKKPGAKDASAKINLEEIYGNASVGSILKNAFKKLKTRKAYH